MILSAAVSLAAIALRYLIVIYPAEEIDELRLFQRLVLIQYGGIFFMVGGAVLVARTILERRRRIMIGALIVLIVALSFFSALKYSDFDAFAAPETPTVTPPHAGKYRFSTDWVTRHTDLWAKVLAPYKGRGNVQALEVGSFQGRSAIWFLENILIHPNSSITCIDPWGDLNEAGVLNENTFDDNIRLYGQPDKVVKLKGFSEEVLPTLKRESFDFIYIDGSHKSRDVLVDVVFSWRLLKPGGVMILDDYERWDMRTYLVPHQVAKMGIDAFLKVFGPYIEIIHRHAQVVVRKQDGPVDLHRNKRLHDWVIKAQELLAGA